MTMNRQVFVTPSEESLDEFFGSKAVHTVPAEGFWRYEHLRSDGLKLSFSFHLHEQSMQTDVWQDQENLCSVSHENATSLSVIDGSLIGEFLGAGQETRLKINLNPNLEVRWSSLRTQ
jgi:hypothetical protein